MSRTPDVQEREPITSGQGTRRPPAVGKGQALHNVHIALLPKKVTIPIWDKYVQMENICWYNQMLSGNRKKEVQIPPEKKANTQRLSNLCQRRCCSTVRWCQSKECDRFPDSTTTQRDHRTSRILERAEQIQIQIQTYL